MIIRLHSYLSGSCTFFYIYPFLAASFFLLNHIFSLSGHNLPGKGDYYKKAERRDHDSHSPDLE